jgi:hypothetical protein
MGLPWIRLDTAMPDNPKILHLIDGHKDGLAAAFVWVCSLTYAGKHGTDGFITKSALARCNGKPIHARLLVEQHLWKDEHGVGWTINGWADVQESNEETQKRSERARNAALVRWGAARDAED